MPRLIDLSRPLVSRQAVYPGDPPLLIAPHKHIAQDSFNLSQLSMGTHQGTHVDAPLHFYPKGLSIAQMPLDCFMGPATLVDLAPRRPLAAKTWITVEMFRPQARAIIPGAKIIYRTGWERFIGKDQYYHDYPSLTPQACQWLVTRQITLLGMDTPGPSSAWLECHRILLSGKAPVVIVEGLVHLRKLPRRFTFVGFPLAIAAGDGSPIRAVAIVNR